MLICILTKNVITSCSVTMMLFLHWEVKPLMTLKTVLYLSCALISGHLAMMFFFFQAEDDIRVVAVTGVQTCALPISHPPRDRRARATPPAWPLPPGRGCRRSTRSEERRVGKDYFAWWPVKC